MRELCRSCGDISTHAPATTTREARHHHPHHHHTRTQVHLHLLTVETLSLSLILSLSFLIHCHTHAYLASTRRACGCTPIASKRSIHSHLTLSYYQLTLPPLPLSSIPIGQPHLPTQAPASPPHPTLPLQDGSWRMHSSSSPLDGIAPVGKPDGVVDGAAIRSVDETRRNMDPAYAAAARRRTVQCDPVPRVPLPGDFMSLPVVVGGRREAPMQQSGAQLPQRRQGQQQEEAAQLDHPRSGCAWR